MTMIGVDSGRFLDPRRRTSLYAKAMLIRSVEQRQLQLFSEGKLFGTVHTCIGQEWTGIAISEALQEGDFIYSNHRGHGHYLARTDDVYGLIAEVMGKATGVCGGRGGSQNLHAGHFFSAGVQGGIVPVSAGLALGQQMRQSANITVVFIGDGTLGEGAVYEALNIASKWDLPLLIVLENNSYAQSTPQRQTLAGDICARAGAFAIKTAHGNTWEPEALLDLAADCVSFVRHRRRPLFLQIDTYRLMAHSKGDDERDRQEIQSYWDKDPIAIFAREHPDVSVRIQAEIDERINTSVAHAEADAYAGPTAVDEDVPPYSKLVWQPIVNESSDRVVNRIHAALARNMRRDERIILIGEDIEGPYGGAFKVTKDLSQQFPGRVRNTPISEAAVIGIGSGLALNGFLPVCEIMFGDFLALAADQLINHACKFNYLYNDRVKVPLVVRTPMGGRRGYGATHSQSLEKHFLGMPGTLMLAINHRYDPALVFDTLLKSNDRPAIVIENKLLYGVRVSHSAPDGFVWEQSDERYPTTRLRPQGRPDLTVLCYGGMLPEVERAVDTLLDRHEIVCEVVCPIQLYPLNPWPIIESIRESGRLLVVEEGQTFAAFGAEVIAQIHETAPGVLKNARRLGPPRHAIPSCARLEKELLPGETHVIEAAMEIMDVE
jgi:2-oxoisovalerate dehydrogenase E1 component